MCNFPDPEVVREIATNLWKMGFQPTKKVRFDDEKDEEKELVQLARHIATSEHAEAFVRGVVIAENPKVGPEIEALRQKFLRNIGIQCSILRFEVRPPSVVHSGRPPSN